MGNDITKQENRDVVLLNLAKNNVLNLTEEYQGMIAKISEQFPSIRKSSLGFYKKSSQFKTALLDMNAVTPLRTLEQVLASIDQTKDALVNAFYSLEKSMLQAKLKEQEMENEKNILQKDIFRIEHSEMLYGIANTEQYIKGALRTMTFLTAQHENILAKLNIENLSEEMYEAQEFRHHIMTAFKQALNAARANSGTIDEGNHIYLFEMGINGAVAQLAIHNYLQAELNMIQEGNQPTHKMTLDWLEACANEFQHNPELYAAWRGMTIQEKIALHKE
jgi:hypothetical protein